MLLSERSSMAISLLHGKSGHPKQKLTSALRSLEQCFLRKAHCFLRGLQPVHVGILMPWVFTLFFIAKYAAHRAQFIPHGAINFAEFGSILSPSRIFVCLRAHYCLCFLVLKVWDLSENQCDCHLSFNMKNTNSSIVRLRKSEKTATQSVRWTIFSGKCFS